MTKTYGAMLLRMEAFSKSGFLSIKALLYKRAPPDVRNVVPNPDDEMSTAAIVYLCLTYQMRNFRESA